ncbi:MAG: glutaredoxin [Solirubrobacterales bacterium]
MEDRINPAVQPAATLYSKSSCSSCVAAKAMLDRLGVDYRLVDVSGDLDGMRRVAQLTGQVTLPQFVLGDELIGGYDDLRLALQNPRIREQLLPA